MTVNPGTLAGSSVSRRGKMDWSNQYQSRVVSADEAVEVIQSGNRLFMTGNVSVPQKLLEALVNRSATLKDVEICQALLLEPPAFVSSAVEGHLRVNTLFISDNARTSVQVGRANFTP